MSSDHSILRKIGPNKRSIGGYLKKKNIHHDAMAFIVEVVASQTTS